MRNYRWIKDEEEGWCIGSVYDDGDIYLTGNDACFKAEDFEEIGEIVTLGFPSVSKCECGETEDLITICDDCSYNMIEKGL